MHRILILENNKNPHFISAALWPPKKSPASTECKTSLLDLQNWLLDGNDYSDELVLPWKVEGNFPPLVAAFSRKTRKSSALKQLEWKSDRRKIKLNGWLDNGVGRMFIVPDPPLPSVLIGIYARVPLTVCQRIRNQKRESNGERSSSDQTFPLLRLPNNQRERTWFFPKFFFGKLFTCLQSCHEFSTGTIENDPRFSVPSVVTAAAATK